MKAKLNLKQLLRNAQIKIDPEVKRAGLEKLTVQLGNRTLSAPPKWHLARFAAAAIVIISAILYLCRSEDLPVFSSSAFAQVIEATNQANCVHVTISKPGTGSDKQIWRDFARGIMCETQPNGMVRYVDANNGDQYIYHKSMGKIIHSRSNDSDEFMEGMPRPDRMLGELLHEVEGSDANFTVSNDVFDGVDVHVYSIKQNEFNDNGDIKLSANGEIVVEINTNLLVSIKISKYHDDYDERGEMHVSFSYPDSIPEDIYAFGVPQGTEIIDSGPDARLDRVLAAYKHVSENMPLEYVLVEKTQTRLPDGQIRNRTRKFEQSDEVFRALCRLGWPQDICIEDPYITDISIIEDDYSRQKDLICVQVIKQGHRRRSFLSRLPSKKLLYLNPRRGYICEKNESWALREPLWLGGAPWLEGNCEDECHSKYEVTKYAQTETGKWYPAGKSGQTTVWLADGQEEIYQHHFDIELASPQQ